MPYWFNLVSLTFLFFISNTQVTAASSTKPSLDPTLARHLMLIEQYRADPTEFNAQRIRTYDLPVSIDPTLSVFLYLRDEPSTEFYDQLEVAGLRVYPNTFLPKAGAHPYSLILAKGRASSIRALGVESGVMRMAAADRKLQPLNDSTAIETGAAEARNLDTPLRGRGVRIAVLDSGFRPGLPDLPDPAEAMDYADYPDTNRDVRDIANAHGTHVAGTVWGSGVSSNGRWMGMAPDCDPIYLKIGDDSTSNASTAAVVGAIKAAATWCDADILTMSYGGFDGFEDGGSPEEQAVDWATGQGLTCFMSAGNSAWGFVHVSGTLQPGELSEPFQSVIKDAHEGATAGFFLSWYDGPDTSVHRMLTAFVLDGNGDTVRLDSPGQLSSLRGTETREYLLHDPLPRDSSSMFFYAYNNSDQPQQFHIRVYSTIWYMRFMRHDRSYTVCVPSTADSCISVGAYTARSWWKDFQGNEHDDGYQHGAIAYFSSLGPRIDGVMKPNITAPGQRTISCRDTVTYRIGAAQDWLIVSNSGESGLPADYLVLMGTSMSSPAAAGTAALMLEAKPDMTTSQLRDLIYSTARTDDFTGQVPNLTWGWGKIDVMRALESIREVPPYHSFTPGVFGLVTAFPNPFNGSATIQYELLAPGSVQIKVFDLIGRQIWNIERNHRESGKYSLDLPSDAQGVTGTGWVQIEGNGAKRVLHLVNLR